MLKKTVLTAVFCFILGSSRVLAMTYANEPKDFYGLAWGMTVSALEKSGQQFVFAGSVPERQITSYRCATRSDNFYGVLFDKVNYDFFSGRFFLVKALKSEDATSDSQTLYSALVRRHGQPTQQNDNIYQKTVTYLWQGNDTFITLHCNFLRKETILTFYNHPLYQQWSARSQPPPPGRIRERGR
jgi:hypothetical protein